VLILTVLAPRIGAHAQVINTPTPTRTPTPINVGNFVWDDLDHDGRQDAGEPGLAGITVQLWNDARTQLIDSATTNGSGNYSLVAPTPGNYRVRVLLPTGSDFFSPKDSASADDLTDSDINPTGATPGFTDTYIFGSNLISITTIDAGIIIYRTPTPTRTPTPINIGNFVWHDLNSNGIQDAGEPGVGGVVVQLWNGDRTQLIASTTTNSSGIYSLIAPIPGDYRVRVLRPQGSSFSAKDQGEDDTRDSDVNTNLFLVTYGFTDIRTIASNVISITSIDIGLTNVVASPTPTLTFTPSLTPTSTPSPSPTSGVGSGMTLTPQPLFDFEVFLPLLTR
jgi:hypothetical protein